MKQYTFHITIYDLTFVALVFVALTVATQLWVSKSDSRSPNRFLASILGIVVLWIARQLAIDIGLSANLPQWSRLPLDYSLALGPLIYFYVRKIARPDSRFQYVDLLHFAPLLMQLTVFVLETIQGIKTGRENFDTSAFQRLNPVLHLLVFISVAIYLYLSRELIANYYRQLKFIEGDRYRNEFRSLSRFLTGLGLLWLLWIPYSIVDYFFYNYRLRAESSYPLYILLTTMSIWMAARGFLKHSIVVTNEAMRVSKPSLPSELRKKAVWLRKTVKEKRYFEDPGLSLVTLAEKLELTTHELSRMLNTALKKSFNDFINEYRVVIVVQKMQDPAFDHLTLLGIAYDSGFNSQSTFHRAFKELMGKTPAEYKKELPSYKLTVAKSFSAVISNQETIPRWSFEKLNRNYMFRNYLKIAWRNLLRNKVYSALNITGLASGMAVALLIGLWVYSQVSYDRFLPGYELAYKVRYNTNNNGEINTGGATNLPLAEVLKKDFPEIRYVAQTDWMGSHPLSVGDKRINVNGTMAGGDFLKIFQYPLVQGNPGAVLRDPYSIVLSQATATALFGSADPMGKMVKIDNFHDLRVTGILQDVPANSTLQFSFIVPFAYYAATDDEVKRSMNDWNNNSFQTFVGLQPSASYTELAPKLKGTLVKYSSKYFAQTKAELFLEPLKNWHLYAEYRNGTVAGGLIDYVRLFALIGILILVIACINFTNLATARSEQRAREVGVRKAIGSSRKDLILQFLTESMALTSIAFLLSLLLVILALPAFNNLTHAAISIPFASGLFWLIMLSFVLFTGLLSGSRPAFYLSSFNPVKVLKGTFQTGKTANRPREILVVLQFSCSIALIISTIVIYQQIQHAKDRPVGYDASRLVMSDATGDLTRNYDAFKSEMVATGLVSSITKSSSPVTDLWASNSVTSWSGQLPGETLSLAIIGVSDADYFRTLGMRMAAGRNFTGNLGADSLSVVLNEAAVKRMRYKDPIGQVITWHTVQQRATVVGVVKDALMASPFSSSVPTIFIYQPSWSSVVTYRLSPKVNTRAALAKLAPIFTRYNPAIPFQYHFVDESYASKFNFESLIGTLAGLFASLAIIISCIGLFGLAAYMAEKRTKEIGIRKVLGATVPQVWLLLSREFVILVLISCLIASPVSWYYLHDWLLKYSYRITIGPGVFVAAGAGAIALTLLTVSFQAIKAALINPAKSLRTE
ncbi:ABC transporter permease [Mucilaginibacter sp. BT774]|uniref:ABC transporter permease n=1 Tax=Mucilaginibacter sp. BT774 TaxID=3062276 RepID=UPI002676C3F1|nr:ABC transporter permease [Mucilaginibacter sp. BT774]MDO3627464.1 ABC transporter permease [Mucilaginibacter sp. BT774]